MRLVETNSLRKWAAGMLDEARGNLWQETHSLGDQVHLANPLEFAAGAEDDGAIVSTDYTEVENRVWVRMYMASRGMPADYMWVAEGPSRNGPSGQWFVERLVGESIPQPELQEPFAKEAQHAQALGLNALIATADIDGFTEYEARQTGGSE